MAWVQSDKDHLGLRRSPVFSSSRFHLMAFDFAPFRRFGLGLVYSPSQWDHLNWRSDEREDVPFEKPATYSITVCKFCHTRCLRLCYGVTLYFQLVVGSRSRTFDQLHWHYGRGKCEERQRLQLFRTDPCWKRISNRRGCGR